MKGGTIFDNTYENKAIELIKESIDMRMPLNQKSQEWYGQQRAGYLQDAINELNKKIKILDKYSKGWRKSFYGNDIFGMNTNSNNKDNNNSNSNNSTKKNNKSVNYNANNENMSGGKRKYSKKTRKYRK